MTYDGTKKTVWVSYDGTRKRVWGEKCSYEGTRKTMWGGKCPMKVLERSVGWAVSYKGTSKPLAITLPNYIESYSKAKCYF